MTSRNLPRYNFDLGAKFQVINEQANKWVTIAKGVASDKNAKSVARKHNLPGVWVNDGFGRRYVTI